MRNVVRNNGEEEEGDCLSLSLSRHWHLFAWMSFGDAARRQSTRTPFIGKPCVLDDDDDGFLLLLLLLLILLLSLSRLYNVDLLRFVSRCRFSSFRDREVFEQEKKKKSVHVKTTTTTYWDSFTHTYGSRFTWNAVIISPLFRCEAIEWRDGKRGRES